MSSDTFTRVGNTVVSGSSLLASVNPSELSQLLYREALDSNPPIVFAAGTGAGLDQTLTPAHWLQAIADTQDIDYSSSGQINSLLLGSDLASVARTYIQLFNLSSSSNPRVATFRLSRAAPAAFDMILSVPGAATHTNIDMELNGGADASTVDLFDKTKNNFIPGGLAYVEIYGTNFTSGSEVVSFNVVRSVT
jgi:hypothetical protein